MLQAWLKNQTVEIRVITKRCQVVVVLRAKARPCRCQTIMDVGGLGFAFQCTLKHFLRRNIFAAVEFDDAAVIKRIGIARQNAFSPHSRISNSEISTRTCRYFRNLRVFLEQRAKQVAGLAEVTAGKFFMGALKCFQRSRLINRWLAWWRRRDWEGTLCAKGCQLLSLFDSRQRWLAVFDYGW